MSADEVNEAHLFRGHNTTGGFCGSNGRRENRKAELTALCFSIFTPPLYRVEAPVPVLRNSSIEYLPRLRPNDDGRAAVVLPLDERGTTLALRAISAFVIGDTRPPDPHP